MVHTDVMLIYIFFFHFSTDEDARLAMRMSGTSLKGIQVTLLLSSRTEMQKVIEAARQQAMALQGYQAPPVIPSQPQQQPGASPAQQQQQPAPAPAPAPPPQVQPQVQQQQQQQPPPQQQQQQLPQPPQPPQMHPPSQGTPTPAQPLVPPPHMQQHQHPSPMPYPMHGYPSTGPDGHQPLPPMPPHMPHVPPVTMQQMPQMGQPQEGAYNSQANHLENNDSQGPTPKEEKKDEKRTSSSSSSTGKRDSKGRDGRRRRSRTRSRSRSRSRDRDRDRYRRHRSRSRSRSRDRGSRSHRRSRSRERDRFRDKPRDRDRGRDRDRDRERDRGSRMGRDRADRSSQDSNKASDQSNKDVEVIAASGGIPGLGDIPSIDMRGPLPSSLAEPIRNSPIQTPPGPAPNAVPAYNPTPTFNSGSPFPQPMPFNNNMNFPQANVPAPNTVDTPTDMELIAEDDGSLDQDGPTEGEGNPPEPELEGSKPPAEFMGGKLEPPMMRGGVPGEFPPRFGGMPGLPPPPGPQFANRGPMPMRPNNGFQFEEQQGNFHPMEGGGNFPPQMEGGAGFKPENFDPRSRSDQPPQMNWPPGGEGANQGDPSRFRGERDQRGFRGEKEMSRGPMGERDPREGSDMNEDQGNWDPRNRMGHMEEFAPGWNGPNRPEGMKPSMWNGRGRQGNFHPRNERSFEEQERWHDQENWSGNDGYGEGEYEENYPRGFRGRGGRGWDRGRGMERGRGGRGGFNSRHAEFMEGHHEEGFGPHGGRGGFRGRGQPRWGGAHQFNEETSCVELRNVPLSASYRAIREFFQYVYVPSNSVKILTDDQGNRLDVIFVRLSHPADAARVLKHSGNYIFDNSIEVRLLSEAKYDSEVDIRQRGGNRGFKGGPPGEMEKGQVVNSPCLYVMGLPMGCADHDVAPIFDKFKIEDIVIERVRGTRTPSGGCFVRLSSCEEAQKAVVELTNAAIDGSRLSIELCPPSAMAPAVRDRDIILGKIPADKIDKNQEVKKPSPNVADPSSIPHPAEALPVKQAVGSDLLTDSVVIKRVPKDATEANIRDFFSDEGLVPERMHFCEPGTNGVREVFVMFPQTEDAKRALGKHEQQIGKMKVMVELIAKPVVMNAMGLPFDPLELIKKGHKSNVAALAKDENEKVQMKTPLEGAEFIPDEEQDEMLKGEGHMGEPMMNMPFANAYEDHPQFRGRMPSPHPAGRGFMSRGGEMRGMPRVMGPSGRGGMGEFGRMRPPMPRPTAGVSEENIGTAIPPENFGKPGCVVALGNLPYRCTTDDILDFLHEFPELRPEHVIRRYNEFNQPTADARVALATPQDAQKMVQIYNKRPMDNRMIFVSLVQN